MTSVPTRQSWVSVKNATSHSAPPFTNVRVVGPIPSNTSLAYQAVFGELAIKCELKSGEVLSTTTTSAASAEATETAEPRTGVCSAITALETADVSMVRINEHKPDFSALERQLESIYSFAKRGVEPELWYTDTDGDTLRLQDSVGLTYAVEDWRHSLHPTRRRKTGSGSNTAAASMRLFIHQRRP